MKPTESQQRVTQTMEEIRQRGKDSPPVPKHKKLLPRQIVIDFWNPIYEKHGLVKIVENGLDDFHVTFWQKPNKGKAVRMNKPEKYSSLQSAMDRAASYVLCWATEN